MNSNISFWSYIIVLIIFNRCKTYAQEYSELQKLWLGPENHFTISFNSSNVICNDFRFFSTYQIQNDTLTIFHNYDLLEYAVADSSGNVDQSTENRLPNSVYLIEKLAKDELVLSPINQSAKEIFSGLRGQNFFNFSMYKTHEEYIKDEQGIVIDTVYKAIYSPFDYSLNLHSEASVYEELKFDSLEFSYKQNGWNADYYYDLKLNSNGEFFVSYIREEIRKKEKPKTRNDVIYTGFIDLYQLDEISEKLSYSGISSMSLAIGMSMSSHGTDNKMKVFYNGEGKEISGYFNAFSYTMKPFIVEILRINEFENYNVSEKKVYFETSFLKKLQPKIRK